MKKITTITSNTNKITIKQLQYTLLADEYEMSAIKLKCRIDDLCRAQSTTSKEQINRLDERINILYAEYYYLLRVSAYLRNYDNKKSLIIGGVSY